jgi:hypothetical protein
LAWFPLSPASEKKAQKRKPIDFHGFPCYNLFAYYQQESRFFGMPGIRSWSVFADAGRLFFLFYFSFNKRTS